MRAERFFGWCLLAIWSTWLFASEAWLNSIPGAAYWVPDMGILWLLMLDRRSSSRSMLLAVVLISSTRLAFSAEPALAIFFGYGLLVACLRLLHRIVEVDQVILRMLLAGLGVLLVNKYWALARGIALSAAGHSPASGSAWSRALPEGSWSMALASALGVLILGPLMMHLPGISPLRKGEM